MMRSGLVTKATVTFHIHYEIYALSLIYSKTGTEYSQSYSRIHVLCLHTNKQEYHTNRVLSAKKILIGGLMLSWHRGVDVVRTRFLPSCDSSCHVCGEIAAWSSHLDPAVS